MNPSMIAPVARFMFLVFLFCLPGCAPQWYRAEPIEAWVQDEEGKPLDGVIVVARWHVLEGTLAGTNDGGEIQIMETLTDKDGRFYFPAWGPKMLPPKKSGGMVDQYLGNEDPRLLFFRSGYEFLSLTNRLTSDRNTDSLRRSDWNRKRITMRVFSGTSKEYSEHLFLRHFGGIGFAYEGHDCEWTKIPHLLVALHKEKLALEKQDAASASYLFSDPIDHVFEKEGCPSKKEFFKDYLK